MYGPADFRPSRAVQLVLGALLLTTATLKVTGQASEALDQNSVFFRPQVRILIVEVELLLGLWLLSSWAARASWWVALGLFGTLAGVSLSLGLTNHSSCGCFGRLAVSPWGALAIDLTAVGLLGLFPPRDGRLQLPARWCSSLTAVALGAAILLLLGWMGLAATTGADAPALLAWLRGVSVSIDPAISDLGTGHAGDQQVVQVVLTNLTDRPVRIIGGTSDCTCTVASDLPLTIQPGRSQPLNIAVVFRGTPGRFLQQYVFYTDDARQGRVVARLTGTIPAPRPP